MNYWLLVAFGVSALGVVGVGMFVAWPLVLNRRVLGALAILGVVAGLDLAWQAEKQHLRAQGAAECKAANAKANADAEVAKTAFATDLSDAVKEQQATSQSARDALDRARKDRPNHVSLAANRACIIPNGFVYDHDAAVPGSAPTVPPSLAASDLPSGVSLIGVNAAVANNYTECAKLIADVDAANAARYRACIAWDKRFGTTSGCVK